MLTAEGVALFIKSRRAKKRSEYTVIWYQGILRHFAEMFRELPTDPTSIDDFYLSCQAGDERLHGYFRTLRVFYRFLKKRYDIPNIMDKTDAPGRGKKLPRPITIDELDQLLAFPHRLRIQAALMFLSDCGARVAECAGLLPQDLAETEWGLLARVTGKGNKTRLVPISQPTYDILMRVLPFRLSSNRMSRLIAQAFRDAHVKGSAINLRHTFATYFDGDETVLQRIMGHSHISTTQIYRQTRVRKMLAQHREYSPLKLVMARRQLPLWEAPRLDRTT